MLQKNKTERCRSLISLLHCRVDQRRVGVFLQCLLRLLVDVSSDSLLSTSVKEKLTNQTARCLTLLNHCSHGRVQVGQTGRPYSLTIYLTIIFELPSLVCEGSSCVLNG